MIIADVHLGKASHFRKEGISIPAIAQQGDYTALADLFTAIAPLKVYFLGDLFHSSFNRDWHHFCDLIALFPSIKFALVRGNHDLINRQLFRDICIDVVDEIEDPAFIYTHAPLDAVPPGKVNIVGHIHPGIVLSGLGKQHLKLPCFYFTDDILILPAFGSLTGLYSMNLKEASAIYIVLPDGVSKMM